MFRLRRPSKKGQTSSGPHGFIEPRDARSALALGSVQGGLQMASSLAVADASLCESHCALSGCGKPREDPIHWPSE
jgi:hypothetical protein